MSKVFKSMIYFSAMFALGAFFLNLVISFIGFVFAAGKVISGTDSLPDGASAGQSLVGPLSFQVLMMLIAAAAVFFGIKGLLSLLGAAGSGMLGKMLSFGRGSFKKVGDSFRNTTSNKIINNFRNMGDVSRGLRNASPRDLRNLGRLSSALGAKGLGKGLKGVSDGKLALDSLKRAGNKGKLIRAENELKKSEDAANLRDKETKKRRRDKDAQFRRRFGIGDKVFNSLDDEDKSELMNTLYSNAPSEEIADNLDNFFRERNMDPEKAIQNPWMDRRRRAAEAHGENSLNDHINNMKDSDKKNPSGTTIDKDAGETIADNGDDKANNVADRFRETHEETMSSREDANVAGHSTMNSSLDINRTNEELKSSTLNGSDANERTESESRTAGSQIDLAADADNQPIDKKTAESDAKNMSRDMESAIKHQNGMKSDGSEVEENPNIARDENGVAKPVQDDNEITRAGEVLANGNATNGNILPASVKTAEDATDENIERVTAQASETYNSNMNNPDVAMVHAAMGQGEFGNTVAGGVAGGIAGATESDIDSSMGGTTNAQPVANSHDMAEAMDQANIKAEERAMDRNPKIVDAEIVSQPGSTSSSINTPEATPVSNAADNIPQAHTVDQPNRIQDVENQDRNTAQSASDSAGMSSGPVFINKTVNNNGDTHKVTDVTTFRDGDKHTHAHTNHTNRNSTSTTYTNQNNTTFVDGAGNASTSSSSSVSSNRSSNFIPKKDSYVGQDQIDDAMSGIADRHIEEDDERDKRNGTSLKNKSDSGKIRRNKN